MIGSIDLGDGTAITLTYLDRFTVKMPWDADLAYKLENVRTVVDAVSYTHLCTITLSSAAGAR